MGINETMNQFRIASRELFNNFFRIERPYENNGWPLEERFSEIEKLLFRKLVIEPAYIQGDDYGKRQNDLIVKARGGGEVPIMLNRDIDCGYWDYPIQRSAERTKFCFIRFFDWDQLDCRDNRYVRVSVDEWPEHKELVGKHALIESHYVLFEKRV